MYKKLTILLLATTLIITGLFVNQYLQNQNIKRDLLGQYIVAQHNISSYLINAVYYHQAGNNENFITILYNIVGEFRAVDNIIAPGSLLGRHTNASDLMYTIHSSQKNFIMNTLDKAINEELSDEDINRIISFAEAMELYADLLDFEEIIPGNSPGQIINLINDKLNQARQLHTGSDFDQ